MDIGRFKVGDIVRIKDEEWWIKNGYKWPNKPTVLGGISLYGAHHVALGKLKIVRQVTEDGCYLTEHTCTEPVLFPFEMIEDDLRTVSLSEMYEMRNMFTDILREQIKNEFNTKLKYCENTIYKRLRSQWILIADDSMPEVLGKKFSGDEKNSTITEKIMVLCSNGKMVMAQRYRADDNAEWEWLPKMQSTPLYWLQLPEKPKIEVPFVGKMKEEVYSWRSKLTLWLLKIGLIG